MTALVKSIRTALAGLCLVLCSGIVLLWPITHNRNFELFNNVSEWELYCAESWNGKLRVSHSINSAKSSKLNVWRFWSIPEERMRSNYAQYSREWDATFFEAHCDKDRVELALPHLLWAALVFLVAYLIKPTPKLRFAFQDLLLVTFIVATIIGAFTLANNI